MKCPRCGWKGKSSDRFCLLCGSRLEEEVAVFPEKAKEKVCRSCGKTLFDEDIFCGFCGTRVQKQDDCEQIQPKNEVEDLFVAENKKDDQNVVQSTVVDEIKEQFVLADNVTSESDIVEKQEQKENEKKYSVPYSQPKIYKEQAKAASSKKEGSAFGWGLLSFLFPLVGLILFCVWNGTKKHAAKVCGVSALVSFIISIVMGIAMGAFLEEFLKDYDYEDGGYPPYTQGSGAGSGSGTGSGSGSGMGSGSGSGYIPSISDATFNNSDGLTFQYYENSSFIQYDDVTGLVVVACDTKLKIYNKDGSLKTQITYADAYISAMDVYGGNVAVGFRNVHDIYVVSLFDFSQYLIVGSEPTVDVEMDDRYVYFTGDQWSYVYRAQKAQGAKGEAINDFTVYNAHIELNREDKLLYIAEVGLSSSSFYYIDLINKSSKSLAEFGQYEYNYTSPYYDGKHLHAFGHTYDKITGEILTINGYVENITYNELSLGKTLYADNNICFVTASNIYVILYNKTTNKIVHVFDLYATDIKHISGTQYVAICGDSGYIAYIDLSKI